MKKRLLGMIAALFAFMVLLPATARAANTAYAILYADGTLTFQNNAAPQSGKTVSKTYTVDLTAVYDFVVSPAPWHKERKSVRVVSFLDKVSPTSTAYWFYECENLERVYNIRNLDTSDVTDMRCMFANCSALEKLNVSGFDTAKVRSMASMFYGCSGLYALDVSGFDTANVTSMMLMFYRCAKLSTLDISGWDTSKVTNMYWMWAACSKLKTIYASDKFTTASVTNSADMLNDCASLVGGNGTKYDASRVDKTYARIDAPSAPGYFIAKPAPVYAILYADGALTFQKDASPRSGKTVAKTYEVDLTTLYDYEEHVLPPWHDDAEAVRTVAFADVTRPTSTCFWFDGCKNLTRIDDIGNLDASRVVDMGGMFYNCSALTTLNLSGLDTSGVGNMDGMFVNCSALATLNLSGFDTSNVEDMSSMFFGCESLTALDVSGFDMSHVEETGYMFFNCKGLTALDVSGFDTASVTDMSGMFNNCAGLSALNVSGFRTSKVTTMSSMFRSCSGLTALDVSGFDTANVTDMRWMFNGCSALKTIYASDRFTTESVTEGDGLFTACASLVGGGGTKYDGGHVDAEYARIDAASAPGYFTAKGDTPSPVTPSFDVRRDAYAFGNGMSDFGYASRGGGGGGKYPIPAQSVFVIFGNKVRGQMLYKTMSASPWYGNCAGMSASAALLFAYGALNPPDFGKTDAWSMVIGDKNAEMSLLTFVEAMQAAQYADAFAQARQEHNRTAGDLRDGKTLGELWRAVKDDMEANRPTLIGIVKRGVGGHALLAVGADAEQNRLLIYDCNHPGELRYLTVSGDKTAWNYDMGGYGVWGTDGADADLCSVSYVPYAVLEDIWTRRGNLRQDSQVLTLNAENVSITDFEGNPVAALENGELVTKSEGVYELVDLSMHWPDERSVCLPRNNVYTVSTSDDITLSASMTDQHMSAAITTSANTVTFAVDDDERANGVTIEGAKASDTYSVSLESDFEDIRYKGQTLRTITLDGSGTGSDIVISLNQAGELSIPKYNVESWEINGEEQIAHYVTAHAGPGGTVSPQGDARVTAKSDMTFVFTPDAGYEVNSVRVDNAEMGPSPEYTFRQVMKDHVLTVSFERVYGITAAAPDRNALKVTLINKRAATVAASYFDKDGRFLNARLADAEADAGTLTLALSDGAKTARVALLGDDYRPLCDAFKAEIA